MTAWDLKYNIAACVSCVLKKGHPKVYYENSDEEFEETYEEEEVNYYSPEEVLLFFELIRALNLK